MAAVAVGAASLAVTFMTSGTASATTYEAWQNVNSSQCLGNDRSLTPGAGLVQRICDGSLDRGWSFTYMDTNKSQFRLRNYISGQCLAIAGSSKSNGARAVQEPCDGRLDESWSRDNNGSLLLYNANSHLCLAVAAGSFVSGASVIQWTCGLSHREQQWTAFPNT
ncbi:hypothetical protein GCM10023195_01450 [Actinoallomurus liliacearum]|uniref:Ricin B lectin domain-containing protein n=1 Tax=Actinoallomurus liliacearum TaxID=1080073 RepID=A0ABP8TC59_9ACTN